MRAGDLIDAFRPAEGPPPQSLGRFFLWCLSGAWGPLTLAAVLSAIAGVMEVVTAWFLGAIVDAAQSGSPATILADHWPLLAGFAIFLVVLRPIAFGLSAASNSIVVQPNVLPLVLSRLHRWTMGARFSLGTSPSRICMIFIKASLWMCLSTSASRKEHLSRSWKQ